MAFTFTLTWGPLRGRPNPDVTVNLPGASAGGKPRTA